MTANRPNAEQKKFSSHRSHQPSLTPKQRALRDREQLAREVEELREHQRALKRAFYERRGELPPEAAA
jgi:hypothetical protein